MKKFFTIMAISVATFAFTNLLSVSAHECPACRDGMKPPCHKNFTPEGFTKFLEERQNCINKELNLTPEQIQKADCIRQNKTKELIPVVSQIVTLKDNEREINKKYNKEFESILTDEQKTKLKELKAKHRPHHHKCPVAGE